MSRTNLFPLFPQEATQTVTATTDAQVIEVTGRVVTVNVASGEAGIASFQDVPGLMFTVVAGTIAGGATIVLSSHDGGDSITLDATSETATVMLTSDGGLTVVAPIVTDTSS
jgi:hypothetical protein